MYKSDGFIYPAVLFVSAAVLLVISYTSSDFITRKTFAKEAGEYWIGENLLQNGALLSSRHMTQGQKVQTGTQRFPYGTVSFHITGSGSPGNGSGYNSGGNHDRYETGGSPFVRSEEETADSMDGSIKKRRRDNTS